MATIKLKSLITEAEDFQARSKETGKLVHFKSKDSYQSALKAGTHEDPKAEKGGQPKADTGAAGGPSPISSPEKKRGKNRLKLPKYNEPNKSNIYKYIKRGL